MKCEDKKRLSRANANRILPRFAAECSKRGGDWIFLQVYHCEECGWYHIGRLYGVINVELISKVQELLAKKKIRERARRQTAEV